MSSKQLTSLFAIAAMASLLQAGPIFAPSYTASTTFTDVLGYTTMTMAFDGTSYWSTSGGSPDGYRLAQYTSGGAIVGTYAPGLDFRSIFTDASGTVYARQYANSTIYTQTSPGAFTPFVTLNGGSLDSQSSVILNTLGTQFIAMSGGSVSRWDLSGNYLGALTLSGFGGTEGNYPQGRGIAAAGNYYLTYDSNNVLSAWDPVTGARVDQTVLTGAGTSFDSLFSLSYANGQVWIADGPGGTWRGYDVGLGGFGAIPEPATVSMIAGGLALLLMRKLRKNTAWNR